MLKSYSNDFDINANIAFNIYPFRRDRKSPLAFNVHFETNLNLETNVQVLAQWKYFDAEQHKRRRSYVKKIKL